MYATLRTNNKSSGMANNIWRSLRIQIFGGIVFSIVVPLFVWNYLFYNSHVTGQLIQAIAGSAIGLILGIWLFRNISQFPGIEGSSNIVTCFSLSFGAVATYFILSRLEYVRSVLFSGYILSILWFYFLFFVAQRQRNLRIGVVPFGGVGRFERMDGISWFELSRADSLPSDCDAVVADLSVDLPDVWERLLADCALAGIPVYNVKHLLESLTGKVELTHLSENQFGSLIPTSAYLQAKAIGDWLAAALIAPLLLPLFAVVAVLIRMDSAGPVIFAQKRIGYRGVPFTVYKFRTMLSADQQDDSERVQAITRENDPRVTRLGRFLRTSRIDELPQILNVLRGEMSWIGPRPEAVALSEWYEAELPFYRYRHIVRPGITGWAQVNQGHVADVDDVRTKMHYDFYYIRNYSPWLDMIIVARTVRTMLTGFGSK